MIKQYEMKILYKENHRDNQCTANWQHAFLQNSRDTLTFDTAPLRQDMNSCTTFAFEIESQWIWAQLLSTKSEWISALHLRSKSTVNFCITFALDIKIILAIVLRSKYELNSWYHEFYFLISRIEFLISRNEFLISRNEFLISRN